MTFHMTHTANLRRFLTMIFFGAIVVTGLTAAAARAAAVHINCPLDQARRTITTPLPADWWTTPIVNHLSETQVANIGGEPALICKYASSGSVQMKAPAGMSCSAVGGGFNCSSPGVVAPVTFSTGPIVLKQSYLADFDRGAGSGNATADIWFEALTSTKLYLTPRNGAKFAVGDRSLRGFAGCSVASYSGNRVKLSQVPVGSYICVKTNEGRISEFRMNAISAGSPKVLSLGYTTWQ